MKSTTLSVINAAGIYPCILLILLIQGCATLNKDECLTADWRLIGYQDGTTGLPASRVGKYREACARHAVSPDLKMYQAGRDEGLLNYCTAQNGYRVGETGKPYTGVCPAEQDGRFRTAYDAGRQVHLAQARVNQTHTSIYNKQRMLRSLDKEKLHKKSELVRDGINRDRRTLLLYQIEEIDEKIEAIESEISLLEVDLAEQREHLDYMRNHIQQTVPIRASHPEALHPTAPISKLIE